MSRIKPLVMQREEIIRLQSTGSVNVIRPVKPLVQKHMSAGGLESDMIKRCPKNLCGAGVTVCEEYSFGRLSDGSIGVMFRADNKGAAGVKLIDHPGFARPMWHPPSALPVIFSRYTVHGRSVKLVRIRDMSDAEHIAAGFHGGQGSIPGYFYSATPCEHFRFVWDSTNPLTPWESNPFVWVAEMSVFKPLAGGHRS